MLFANTMDTGIKAKSALLHGYKAKQKGLNKFTDASFDQHLICYLLM